MSDTNINVKRLLNKIKFTKNEINFYQVELNEAELFEKNKLQVKLKQLKNELKILIENYKNAINNSSIANNEDLVDKITYGNAIELLSKIPNDSVHLCLSDIPYGINLDEWDILHGNTNSALLGNSPAQANKSGFKKRGKPINGWNNSDRSNNYEYEEWVYSWAVNLFDVMKEGAPVLIFGGRRTIHSAISALEDAGFLLKDIISWEKSNAHHRSQDIFKVLIKRGKSYTINDKLLDLFSEILEAESMQKIKNKLDTEYISYTKLKTDLEEIVSKKIYSEYEYEILERSLSDKLLKVQINQWKGWKLGNLAPYWEPIAWLFKPYNNVKTLTDCVLVNNVGAINVNELKSNGKEPRNIFKFDFKNEDSKFHEAQKPLELMEYIIKGFTQENQIVLDPFIGSGTTAVAAKKLGRHFIGFDINEEYVKIANNRLEEVDFGEMYEEGQFVLF
ncbi:MULTISPECIES: site-specific DNA-methyltransferase [unclassified Exiguobacterium]|uniref:DNA-methyltransferase n=1 Tax=unclassified Exiguobacterium TaxID=2644629 RepID=UPI001BEC2EA0|nr:MULTISPECIES: site-specific DNA-methyltransferase [unclassified Exiguobacterium]